MFKIGAYDAVLQNRVAFYADKIREASEVAEADYWLASGTQTIQGEASSMGWTDQDVLTATEALGAVYREAWIMKPKPTPSTDDPVAPETPGGTDSVERPRPKPATRQAPAGIPLWGKVLMGSAVGLGGIGAVYVLSRLFMGPRRSVL